MAEENEPFITREHSSFYGKKKDGILGMSQKELSEAINRADEDNMDTFVKGKGKPLGEIMKERRKKSKKHYVVLSEAVGEELASALSSAVQMSMSSLATSLMFLNHIADDVRGGTMNQDASLKTIASIRMNVNNAISGIGVMVHIYPPLGDYIKGDMDVHCGKEEEGKEDGDREHEDKEKKR